MTIQPRWAAVAAGVMAGLCLALFAHSIVMLVGDARPTVMTYEEFQRTW